MSVTEPFVVQDCTLGVAGVASRDVADLLSTTVGGQQVPVPDPGPSVLRDCADAEAYVASVCFKHGPPRLVGVELEWLVHGPDPTRPVDPAALAAALGPHAPRTLDPASPALPLPSGSTVTVEPGGQVELASPPLPDLAALHAAVAADAARLHHLLGTHAVYPHARAADPVRGPRRVLDVPRYRAMEQSFDRTGPHGRSAMCATAAVQVCLDAGQGADVARRWAVLHALGPVLLAAFANSPVLHGRRTGWKSSRFAVWRACDPARTAPPPAQDTDPAVDPAAAWARRVLASPLLCVRPDPAGDGEAWRVPRGVTFADWVRGALPGRPTTADLSYHVSTLFPPVRPHGHLEVRYVDAQPDRRWALPAAVLTALLDPDPRYGPDPVDAVLETCLPARDRWTAAARHGLADRVLARAAAAVFLRACARLEAGGAPPGVLADLIDMTERQVLRGRCPADDVAPGEPRPQEGP